MLPLLKSPLSSYDGYKEQAEYLLERELVLPLWITSCLPIFMCLIMLLYRRKKIGQINRKSQRGGGHAGCLSVALAGHGMQISTVCGPMDHCPPDRDT